MYLGIAVIVNGKTVPLLRVGNLKESKRNLPSNWKLLQIWNYGFGLPTLEAQEL